MPAVLAKLLPWILLALICVGAYKLFVAAFGRDVSLSRTRALFFFIVLMALFVVLLDKLF